MKIIGGKKDYFDYLVSYHGYDDHIVYDRRNTEPLNYKWSNRFIFHICGEKYPVIKGNNVEPIFEPSDPRIQEKKRTWSVNLDKQWMQKHFKKPTDLNAKLHQPILCDSGHGNGKLFIPCLADFGFASYINGHDMYERIYAFLGWLKDNPAPPDNQTDKDKIVAYGFCKKTSFRPLIKNK